MPPDRTSSQPTCPVDRTRLTPPNSVKRAPQILCELVDELQVLCSLGCGWSGRRDGWKSHLERECEEVEVDGRRRRSVVCDKGKAKASEDAEMCEGEKCKDVEAEEDEEMTPPPDADAEGGSGACGGCDVPQTTGMGLAEKRVVKQRERELLRRIATLKSEAKQSTGTIEAWKGKVIKLEAQLADALKAEPTLHEPESPTIGSAGSRKGAKKGAVGLDGWDASSSSSWRDEPKRRWDHPARCDRCSESIRGVRHKCPSHLPFVIIGSRPSKGFKCPDFDLCDDCLVFASVFHPLHDFAPLRNPSDVEVRAVRPPPLNSLPRSDDRLRSCPSGRSPTPA